MVTSKLYIKVMLYNYVKSSIITKDLLKTLSPLEVNIINVLSKNKKHRVNEIYSVLKKNKIAKSSISVLLDRLYKKGLVKRETENCQGGVRFVYNLADNKEDYEKEIIESTLHKLVEKYGNKALAYFNENFKIRKNGNR